MHTSVTTPSKVVAVAVLASGLTVMVMAVVALIAPWGR
jgi:hypothetical protein